MSACLCMFVRGQSIYLAQAAHDEVAVSFLGYDGARAEVDVV